MQKEEEYFLGWKAEKRENKRKEADHICKGKWCGYQSVDDLDSGRML